MEDLKTPKSSLSFKHFGHTINLDELRFEQEVSDRLYCAWLDSGIPNLTEFVALQFEQSTDLADAIDEVVSILYDSCREVETVPTRVLLDSDRRQNRSLRSFFVQRFLRVFYGSIKILDLGCGKCQLLKELMEKRSYFKTGFDFSYYGMDVNFSPLKEVTAEYPTSMKEFLRNKGFDFSGKLFRLDFSHPRSYEPIIAFCKKNAITHVVGFNGLQYFNPGSLQELVKGLTSAGISVVSIMPDHDFIVASNLVPSTMREDADGELKLVVSIDGVLYDEYFLTTTFLERLGHVETGPSFWLKTTSNAIESEVQLCSSRLFIAYPDMPVHDVVAVPIGRAPSDRIPTESCCMPINWTVLSTFMESPPTKVGPKKNGVMVRLFQDLAVTRDGIVYRMTCESERPLVLDGFAELLFVDDVWRVYPLDIKQIGMVKLAPNSYHHYDLFSVDGSMVRDLEDLTRYVGSLEGLVFDLGKMTKKRNTEVYLKPHLVLDLDLETEEWESMPVENYLGPGKYECAIDLNNQVVQVIRPRTTSNELCTIERGVDFYSNYGREIRELYSRYSKFPSFDEYCGMLRNCLSQHDSWDVGDLPQFEVHVPEVHVPY
jgi:SAM-dependent methyltransferase